MARQITRVLISSTPTEFTHGAEAAREAITSAVTVLPEQLWRSLAWDQGAEMAQHARLRIDEAAGPNLAIERPTTQSYRRERYIGNRAAGGRTHMAG